MTVLLYVEPDGYATALQVNGIFNTHFYLKKNLCLVKTKSCNALT